MFAGQVFQRGERLQSARGRQRDLFELARGQFREFGAETQLVQQVEGGGMHGVAAEVAQEVLVFLQHGHFDTGPGQQQSQHHAGGSTADHQTGRAFHRLPPPRSPARIPPC
ncbi:hypothetical protein FG87_36870 [Nocardia vulneris]|uniref:Uncharacterized protein n=1 Tax=Nocardia vulneris TaxID=1141657 RepID=A0ABR4Z552_9NOCA|nr:hypothetical protein FG87_36870 [Nocardia vulneris]